MNEHAPIPEPVALKVGRVLLQTEGDELLVSSSKAPGLVARIPLARLETWALRLLREELAA